MTSHNQHQRDEFGHSADLLHADIQEAGSGDDHSTNRSQDRMPATMSVTNDAGCEKTVVVTDEGQQWTVNKMLGLMDEEEKLTRLIRQYFGIAPEAAESRANLFPTKHGW
jgi:hypothetical protein